MNFKEVLKGYLEREPLEYRRVLEEELGEALRYLREEAGFSPEEVAERAGLEPAEVLALEERFPFSVPLEALLRIVLGLGLSVQIEFAEDGEAKARFTLSPEEGRALGV